MYLGSRTAEPAAWPPPSWARGPSSWRHQPDGRVRCWPPRAIEADGGLDVLINNAGVEERGAGNAVIAPPT